MAPVVAPIATPCRKRTNITTMRTLSKVLLVLISMGLTESFTFKTPTTSRFNVLSQQQQQHRVSPPPSQRQRQDYLRQSSPPSRSNTALSALLDVPDGFFTITFPMLGILLSLSKNFVRVRMEERAWEQRLDEGRQERLNNDPTLTELDLRRREAAMEWSAYGKPRMDEAENQAPLKSESGRRRVKVMDREDDDGDVDVDPREYRMSNDEISAFEVEYGVDYDPYYDDPYAEDELPDDKYQIDRMYGDRVYESGEIFYKDKESNLYYRQGAKPRNLSFWS